MRVLSKELLLRVLLKELLGSSIMSEGTVQPYQGELDVPHTSLALAVKKDKGPAVQPKKEKAMHKVAPQSRYWAPPAFKRL